LWLEENQEQGNNVPAVLEAIVPALVPVEMEDILLPYKNSSLCVTDIDLLYPDLEPADYVTTSVASLCSGLLFWKVSELKDFEVLSFHSSYTTTQDSIFEG
jgi:hypothetical protein